MKRPNLAREKKRSTGFYVLDDRGSVHQAANIHEWGAFFEQTEKRRVKETRIGKARVSTVFTGVDYLDPPRLWETMVFGGRIDGAGRKATSLEQALLDHDALCGEVRLRQRKPRKAKR